MTLHDDFLAIDLAAIDRFVAERHPEDLRLDFKELARSPDFDKQDKKNFAKAMSGFANSDGGIIVWGVEARKDADGVDAATAKKPIPNVDAAHSKILSLTGEATGPIVDGVEHRVIREVGVNTTNGYILTYVPRSDSGPHMARLAEGRYYKRSGDSFYPLEHFDLEDMFGRRPKPKLEIVTHVIRGGTTSSGGLVDIGVEIIVGIRNVGRGIARFPFLKISVSNSYRVTRFGLDGNEHHGLPTRPRVAGAEVPVSFHGGANDVIHPSDELYVTKLRGSFVRGKCPQEVSAVCCFGAECFSLTATTLRISSTEIEEAIGSGDARGR